MKWLVLKHSLPSVESRRYGTGWNPASMAPHVWRLVQPSYRDVHSTASVPRLIKHLYDAALDWTWTALPQEQFQIKCSQAGIFSDLLYNMKCTVQSQLRCQGKEHNRIHYLRPEHPTNATNSPTDRNRYDLQINHIYQGQAGFPTPFPHFEKLKVPCLRLANSTRK
jgi:hypothetical protein